TLTVNGSGFVQQSVVQWNGVNKPTTFINGTQLQAAISATDVSGPTIGSVDVVNPAPGGGASGYAQVSVNAAGPALAITQFDFNTCPILNAYVTLTDRNGSAIPGLSNVSVKCSEDGNPVYCDVGPASANLIPLSIALVIDTSAGTATGGLLTEKAAATELISQLGPDASVALIQADAAANLLQTFVANKPTLIGIVNGLNSGSGGAALYDAVDMAIKITSQQHAKRQAVVILTEDDNGAGAIQSSFSVLNESIAAGLPVYALTVTPGSQIPNLVSFLNQVTLNSYGTLYLDSPAHGLTFTMDQLAGILENQYLVSYTTQTPGAMHTLGIVNGFPPGAGTTSRTYQSCVAH
ncbi:MAG: VWA domain-containing protein, partial [Bryobacteraceae bacterium]